MQNDNPRGPDYVCACMLVRQDVWVFGRVLLEGVNSHSCVRSNWRGFQSFLWQTKTKTGGRTRDADRVGDWETKTANNLIVSLSGLIFQANDYHMQTHILCQRPSAKTREQIPAIVPAPPLQLRGSFPARRGENTPHFFRPLSSAVPQKAPNASALSM